MVLAVIGRLVAAGMLFYALADHPYAYFTLLRFIVCTVASYCAVQANSQKNEQWTWVYGVIAVLFNPIIPIHLSRGLWIIIDLAAAIVILVSLFIGPKWKGS